MFTTLLRVLFGFLIACLAAGLVTVGFVITPSELFALPENAMYDRMGHAGVLSLVAATQSAVFAAPFALVAAAIAEWQSLRSFFYYAAVGLVISSGGFVALYAAELENQPSIVNSYAMVAYAAAGLIAGAIYWLLAGRFAGEPDFEDDLAPPIVTGPPKVARPAAAVPVARNTPTPGAPPPSSSIPSIPARKS